jgi:type II secretory pathway pseudopilin PulG
MLSKSESPLPAQKALGFSLVEIVVVVSLLGMATAFAVPRFTSLANRSRASEVQALSARLRNAAQSAHAQFVASGATLAAAKVDGKSVVLMNGYPEASNVGITNAVLEWGGFTTKSSPASVVFFKTGAPFDAQCSVTYKAAPAPSTAAAITDINISGC